MQTLPTDALPIAMPSLASDFPLTSGELSVPSSATIAARPPALADLNADRSLSPILVADDDADDRYFIRRFISKTGTPNPVKVFDDGSEVVNYLGAIAAAGPEVRRRAPRLLFLDLKMTGLGGFGFLEWVRQQKSALPMTIVVLSNSAEPEDMARAMELGAHRYLVKYPSIHTFSTIIRSVYPFTLSH